jgi:hypothetical protein
MTPSQHPQFAGELEYGSILPNGDDWRLRKFDAGMGETEYRIFKNGVFFAQFDNRKDADLVMGLMTISPRNDSDIKILKDAIIEVLDTGLFVLGRIDTWQREQLRQQQGDLR